jgi:hypothetical protein
MSRPDDDDDNLSQDEDERDMDPNGLNDEQQNIFLTDDPNLQAFTQHQFQDFDEVEPIEARPPNEIDTDEQERHQSGTPAFRTLDDVGRKTSAWTFVHFSLSRSMFQLFRDGLLSGTQMAMLKSKYIDLQNALTQ